MRHHVKKIKFKGGRDGTTSLMRKLVVNFIYRGKIETTVRRAKMLKKVVDRLVYQAKDNKESTNNTLLKKVNDLAVVRQLTNVIAPLFTDRAAGFVKIAKIGQRLGDGAEMARIEWTKEIAIKNKSTHASSNDINETSK